MPFRPPCPLRAAFPAQAGSGRPRPGPGGLVSMPYKDVMSFHLCKTSARVRMCREEGARYRSKSAGTHSLSVLFVGKPYAAITARSGRPRRHSTADAAAMTSAAARRNDGAALCAANDGPLCGNVWRNSATQ